MYKEMKKTLMITAFISIFVLCILIILIGNHTFNLIEDHYRDSKISQVNYFFDQNEKDLERIAITNAVWTDSLEALANGNDEWLTDNATEYVVLDDSFDIDYMFIMNEDGTYVRSYGSLKHDNIESVSGYKNTRIKKEKYFEITWFNEVPVMLYSSPFYDNEEENPSGCYILGRVIDERDFSEIKILLSDSLVEDIMITKTRMILTDEKYGTMNFSHLIKRNSDAYITISLNLKYYRKIAFETTAVIIVFLFVVALIAITYLSSNISNLSKNLALIIQTINGIADGDYHVKLEKSDNKGMVDVNTLIDSINKMSDDIENSIGKAEEYADKIDEKYFEMIELLVNVVEMNDLYTYHHSVSVSDYALMIGRAINFDDLANLDLAAKLHDIGKVSISTEILNKPGKLTDEEYSIIKTHSIKGFSLLNKVDRFEVAKYGVLHHHEYYNGKGYPAGLAGDQIPLIAQIISVADMYDALTSNRAYRDAMDSVAAIRILNEEKGKMLNPHLVDIFCEELSKKK